MSKLIHSNIQKTKTREKEIHAKKKKTETNAPHALFAHRSWTTIRRENDAGVSRFFGDDASAFPFALMKEEERYKKNTPSPKKEGKEEVVFLKIFKNTHENETLKKIERFCLRRPKHARARAMNTTGTITTITTTTTTTPVDDDDTMRMVVKKSFVIGVFGVGVVL